MNFASPRPVGEAIIQYERSRANLTAKEIDIPGFRIAYLEGGHGEPLVLVHGSGEDKDNWLRVSKYLTRHYRIITPDLPGFGESDKPLDRPYSAMEQARNLRAFTRALGLASHHLGGHSLGGKISALYAAQNPATVRSLCLLAPAGVYSAQPSQMQKLLRERITIPISGRTFKKFDQLLLFTMSKPPFVSRPVKKVLIERAIADFDLHNRIYQEIQQEALALEDIVQDLAVPTRIVWGDQDRVLHVSGAEILESLLPVSSVLILKGVGHAPMIEEPRLVAEDLISFIQGIES